MALPNDHVSHLVAVKRNRAKNIDSDRLMRRWAWLVGAVLMNSGQFRSRMDWAMRSAELSAIQQQLVDRGVDPQLLDVVRDLAAVDR